MILLKKLQINNFLSYEEAEIDFPINAQISIEGASGSGKSSIVDAIIWCFFGKGRSDNRNLIHSGAKNCSVILTLLDGTKTYRIERTCSAAGKQGLNITIQDGEGEETPLQRTGLKDHQDWVENDLLHSSYTLFINSIAYPQENAESFVRQTAARRKDLLLEIARAADYDIFYNRAREKSQLISASLIRDNTSLDLAKRAIADAAPVVEAEEDAIAKKAGVEEDIIKQRAMLDALKDSLRDYRSLEAEKTSINRDIGELTHNINRSNARIAEIEQRIAQLQDIDIDLVNAKLEEIAVYKKEFADLQEVERYNADRQVKLNAIILNKPTEYDHDRAITNLNNQLIEVLSHENKPCPDGKHCSCYGESYKKRAAEIETLLVEATQAKSAQEVAMLQYQEKLNAVGEAKGDGNTYAKILEVKRKIEALLPYEDLKKSFESRGDLIAANIKQKAVHAGDVAEAQGKIDTRTVELKVVEGKIAAVDHYKINNEIAARETAISSMESMRSQYAHTISLATAAKESIAKNTVLVAQYTDSIAEASENLECIDMIKDAFGSKGIKTIVVDYLIPRLEDTINDVLSQLSNFRVRLDTQKKTVDGESVVDGLFISIFNDEGEEFDFANYSGGQKLKISVAIAEALASVQRVGFRIFDEAMTALDEASMDSFSSVMTSLQSKFSQILCISHIRMIQDRFPEKLNVSINHGVSLIS